MTTPPARKAAVVAAPTNRGEVDSSTREHGSGSDAIQTLRCRTVAKGQFHQLNYIRGLAPQAVPEDAAENLLAEDLAPNASEALLAAFGSCLAVGIHAGAVARRIPIRGLEIQLEAEMSMAALGSGKSAVPGPIGFEAIRVVVMLDADAPPELLDSLVKHATLWSPVANTLHNPVHLDVTIGTTAPIDSGVTASER